MVNLQSRWEIVLPIAAIGLIAGCSVLKQETDKKSPGILAAVNRQDQQPPSSPSPAAPELPATFNEEVRVGGGLMLGDTDHLAYQPTEFGLLLVEMIDQQKWNSLKHIVGVYPDLTLKLITESGGRIPWSHIKVIAKVFDSHWRGEGEDTWQNFAEQLEANSSGSHNLASQRAEFLRLLSTNQAEQALSLRLEKSLPKNPGNLATAEVLRLEGIAYLMLEDYPRSIERLTEALQLVRSSHPYFSSHIGLLLGEAHRHSGNQHLWKQSWQGAIEIQSQWVDQRALNDPGFWKKAAFLRPVDVNWPRPVIERLKLALEKENLKFDRQNSLDDEAVIWAMIGRQSLRRRESHNAILSYKKSEALVSDPKLKQELQMQQAIAMIEGGQPGPASAILIRMSSETGLLADRAKAILATLKLQNGSLAQGMNLLQVAIKTSDQWPDTERLRAQADYGLALLMRGHEQDGVDLLNRVHAGFLEAREYDHAVQCLWNIAKFYEKTKQPMLAESTQARMVQLENSL